MEYLPGGESLVGDAAEISAGTGALLELLAPAFPNITWTPTEFIPPQRVTSTDTQWARWGKIGRGAQDLTTIDAHLSHFPKPDISDCCVIKIVQELKFRDIRGGSQNVLLHFVTPCPAALFDAIRTSFIGSSRTLAAPTSFMTALCKNFPLVLS